MFFGGFIWKRMTNSRSGFEIFFFFFFFLNIRVGVSCAPLNSALSSKKDSPFCEQKKCDQEYRTNRSEVLLFCEESKIGNENVSLNLIQDTLNRTFTSLEIKSSENQDSYPSIQFMTNQLGQFMRWIPEHLITVGAWIPNIGILSILECQTFWSLVFQWSKYKIVWTIGKPSFG